MTTNNNHNPDQATESIAQKAETLLELMNDDPAANLPGVLGQEATLMQGASQAITDGNWRDAQVILQTVYRLHQLQEREMDSADLRGQAVDALVLREPLQAADGGADLFAYVMYSSAEAAFMNGDYESASNVNSMLRTWAGDRMANAQPGEEIDRTRLQAALHQAGVIATRMGRHEQAMQFFHEEEQQLEAFADASDSQWAEMHFGIGQVHHSQLDYEQAKISYTLSLSLYEMTDDYRSQVKVLRALGLACNFQNMPDWAHYWYSRALKLIEDNEDTLLSIPVIHSLGTVEHVRNNFDEARNFYHEALRRSDAANQQSHMCVEFHHLGTLAQLEQKYDEAKNWLEVAHQYRTELNEPRAAADEARQLGLLFHEQQIWPDALEWYQRAADGYEDVNDVMGAARTYGQMSIVADETNDLPQAVRWAVLTNRLSVDHELAEMAELSLQQLETLKNKMGDGPFQQCLDEIEAQEADAS